MVRRKSRPSKDLSVEASRLAHERMLLGSTLDLDTSPRNFMTGRGDPNNTTEIIEETHYNIGPVVQK
jgi:hypothetical protein